jgi:heme-degrading monooxygenase HmoA
MEETQMIESNLRYDLLPNLDMKAYKEWVKKAVEVMAKQPGMIEFRANRNVLGSPQIRTSTTWRSLEDWAKYEQSNTWHLMQAELRGFATNVKIELWGPSPLVSEPVRSAR